MAYGKHKANAANLIDRTKAIVAARKRGWTLEQIGFACNFSRERARQILDLEMVRVKPRPLRLKTTKYQRVCPRCGKTEWVTKAGLKTKYCSQVCSGIANRTCGGRFGQIDAIKSRLNGLTWAAIARERGHPPQNYWSGIWWLLDEYRFLKMGIVSQIFSERGIDYQTRSTGLVPERGFFPDDWLDELTRRVTEDGDNRTLTRKHRPYVKVRAKTDNPKYYKPWTNREDKVLREIYPTQKTVVQIAKIFNRSRSSITAHALKLGLKKPPRNYQSSSGVTGVSFYPQTNRWEARHGRVRLGYFKSFEDAVNARRTWEQTKGD